MRKIKMEHDDSNLEKVRNSKTPETKVKRTEKLK